MTSGKKDTTKKGSEELIDAAIANIEEDRQRLIGFCEKATTSDDPLLVATALENITKITDSLTKQNTLLIELAKLRKKSAPACVEDDDAPLTKQDREGLYSEIEGKDEYLS